MSPFDYPEDFFDGVSFMSEDAGGDVAIKDRIVEELQDFVGRNPKLTGLEDNLASSRYFIDLSLDAVFVEGDPFGVFSNDLVEIVETPA